MRLKTEVREGVPAGRSPVSLGTIRFRRAGARAPRTLKPARRAGWRALTLPFQPTLQAFHKESRSIWAPGAEETKTSPTRALS